MRILLDIIVPSLDRFGVIGCQQWSKCIFLWVRENPTKSYKQTKLIFFSHDSLILMLLSFQFASRAKVIKNKPEVNEVVSDAAMLKRYRNQIKQMERKMQEVLLL